MLNSSLTCLIVFVCTCEKTEDNFSNVVGGGIRSFFFFLADVSDWLVAHQLIHLDWSASLSNPVTNGEMPLTCHHHVLMPS